MYIYIYIYIYVYRAPPPARPTLAVPPRPEGTKRATSVKVIMLCLLVCVLFIDIIVSLCFCSWAACRRPPPASGACHQTYVDTQLREYTTTLIHHRNYIYIIYYYYFL